MFVEAFCKDPETIVSTFKLGLEAYTMKALRAKGSASSRQRSSLDRDPRWSSPRSFDEEAHDTPAQAAPTRQTRQFRESAHVPRRKASLGRGKRRETYAQRQERLRLAGDEKIFESISERKKRALRSVFEVCKR